MGKNFIIKNLKLFLIILIIFILYNLIKKQNIFQRLENYSTIEYNKINLKKTNINYISTTNENLKLEFKVKNITEKNSIYICKELTSEECIKYFMEESNIGQEFGVKLNWDKESYFKDQSKRTDSFPFVTGDTFRLISDYVLDQVENTIPKDFNLIDKAKIFVKTDYLGLFFGDYFPNFKKRIILITHNSDYPITEKYKNYLEDNRLIVWFAQNPDFSHSKLIPIPIGFFNAYFSNIYNENIRNVWENHLQLWNERKINLYLNYNFKTNVQAREKFLTFFESLKGVMIMKNRVTFSKYITHLNNSKFVLCPRGNGLDTHRFYETVLMGAIPIVESSAMNSVYENSTVLVLSKLTDLTQDMLENPHKYIKNMNFSKHVLRMETWLKKIYSYD